MDRLPAADLLSAVHLTFDRKLWLLQLINRALIFFYPQSFVVVVVAVVAVVVLLFFGFQR